jgi:hypothetical protein
MRLTRVPINIDGVNSVVEFEIVEIMDTFQSYPYFLGLYWGFENQAIINLKKREICGAHEKGN